MSRRYLSLTLAFAVHSCFSCLFAASIEARLPNGRLITPAGDWLTLAPYPFSVAVRPDGKQLVIPSIGYPFSLNIVDLPGTPAARLRQVPSTVKSVPEVEVHAGVAY